MKSVVLCLAWAVLLATVFCSSTVSIVRRYDNEPLIQFNITNARQLEVLSDVQNDQPELFDIWSHDSLFVVGAPNQVHVSHLRKAEQILNSLNISYTILIPNIQDLIDNQHDAPSDDPTWFNSYHTFESIVWELRRLCSSAPSLCVLSTIGNSIEGRSIFTVRLTGELAGSKYKIWLSGGQHAREWVSPATVMYMLNKLITSYGVDPQITTLLNTFEFVVIPVCNPDGYDYSWTNARLWRKNRRNNGNNIYGVDLNRNWDNHWAESGSSSNPSSDTYHGKSPFSEPETKAISDYFLKIGAGAELSLAIDYHAYSQLILRPYHWGKATPPTEAQLNSYGAGIKAAIKATHNVEYSNIPGWELYVASGGADDWFYQQGRAKLAYTIELRDTGRYGFVLPASQILPTGQENYNALIWALQQIAKQLPKINTKI